MTNMKDRLRARARAAAKLSMQRRMKANSPRTAESNDQKTTQAVTAQDRKWWTRAKAKGVQEKSLLESAVEPEWVSFNDTIDDIANTGTPDLPANSVQAAAVEVAPQAETSPSDTFSVDLFDAFETPPREGKDTGDEKSQTKEQQEEICGSFVVETPPRQQDRDRLRDESKDNHASREFHHPTPPPHVPPHRNESSTEFSPRKLQDSRDELSSDRSCPVSMAPKQPKSTTKSVESQPRKDQNLSKASKIESVLDSIEMLAPTDDSYDDNSASDTSSQGSTASSDLECTYMPNRDNSVKISIVAEDEPTAKEVEINERVAENSGRDVEDTKESLGSFVSGAMGDKVVTEMKQSLQQVLDATSSVAQMQSAHSFTNTVTGSLAESEIRAMQTWEETATDESYDDDNGVMANIKITDSHALDAPHIECTCAESKNKSDSVEAAEVVLKEVPPSRLELPAGKNTIMELVEVQINPEDGATSKVTSSTESKKCDVEETKRDAQNNDKVVRFDGISAEMILKQSRLTSIFMGPKATKAADDADMRKDDEVTLTDDETYESDDLDCDTLSSYDGSTDGDSLEDSGEDNPSDSSGGIVETDDDEVVPTDRSALQIGEVMKEMFSPREIRAMTCDLGCMTKEFFGEVVFGREPQCDNDFGYCY